MARSTQYEIKTEVAGQFAILVTEVPKWNLLKGEYLVICVTFAVTDIDLQYAIRCSMHSIESIRWNDETTCVVVIKLQSRLYDVQERLQMLAAILNNCCEKLTEGNQPVSKSVKM
jgi:hypothetical protein